MKFFAFLFLLSSLNTNSMHLTKKPPVHVKMRKEFRCVVQPSPTMGNNFSSYARPFRNVIKTPGNSKKVNSSFQPFHLANQYALLKETQCSFNPKRKLWGFVLGYMKGESDAEGNAKTSIKRIKRIVKKTIEVSKMREVELTENYEKHSLQQENIITRLTHEVEHLRSKLDESILESTNKTKNRQIWDLEEENKRLRRLLKEHEKDEKENMTSGDDSSMQLKSYTYPMIDYWN